MRGARVQITWTCRPRRGLQFTLAARPAAQHAGCSERVRLALRLLARQPGLCHAIGDAVLPALARRPDLVSRLISVHAAPGERGRLADAHERAAASGSFLDATRGGCGGLIDDYLTYAAGWDFPLDEVHHEVHLWHGAGDSLVPVEHALQLAASLPRCEVHIDPDEGHHSFRSSLAEILAALVSYRPRATPGSPTRSLGRASRQPVNQ
jgi:pimeloyl-ACP methyl ester carboxylesterase